MTSPLGWPTSDETTEGDASGASSVTGPGVAAPAVIPGLRVGLDGVESGTPPALGSTPPVHAPVTNLGRPRHTGPPNPPQPLRRSHDGQQPYRDGGDLMTPAEHIAEAEMLLAQSRRNWDARCYVAAAQVHATIAVAASLQPSPTVHIHAAQQRVLDLAEQAKPC